MDISCRYFRLFCTHLCALSIPIECLTLDKVRQLFNHTCNAVARTTVILRLTSSLDFIKPKTVYCLCYRPRAEFYYPISLLFRCICYFKHAYLIPYMLQIIKFKFVHAGRSYTQPTIYSFLETFVHLTFVRRIIIVIKQLNILATLLAQHSWQLSLLT